VREKAVRTALFEFVPPRSGMFIWIKINVAAHPRRLAGKDEDKDEDETLEMQFWMKLAKGGVLTAPGWFFSSHISDGNEPDFDREGHLRVSFSFATTEDMQKGIKIFEKTLRDFFGV